MFNISTNYFFEHTVDIYQISYGWSILSKRFGDIFVPIVDKLINILDEELEYMNEEEYVEGGDDMELDDENCEYISYIVTSNYEEIYSSIINII